MLIFKLPYVRVPVLSKTIVSTLLMASNTSLVLINIPFLAVIPIATTTANGVASPKAQGQDITKTVTNLVSEIFKLYPNSK